MTPKDLERVKCVIARLEVQADFQSAHPHEGSEKLRGQLQGEAHAIRNLLDEHIHYETLPTTTRGFGHET